MFIRGNFKTVEANRKQCNFLKHSFSPNEKDLFCLHGSGWEYIV